ncbi:alpha/beta fold hydrolase [Novosphingobium sp. Gsoil 351]|uniref:alpha/beta fold hydrolase n=1 Tax=Novosphingobium sp. Gsoil 351 TaxID=2675225 RepID=UPI0012B44DDC|nr:alpha/beta hydrolase [Novosphingobium sp. Gsoil 351]QGN55647.1 alpha/beta fold hydrolase [Novosphingobium sp. Gsoil 351]
MPNWLLRLLAPEWSGSVVGLILVGIGLLGSGAWLMLAACGTLIVTGNIVHLVRFAASRRRCPAPGKLVDVGCTRVHVLAEGAATDHLPIVMFGGGHAPGAAMAHLHRTLRELTRSILIDRPGTGWSDTGPFPRSTAREAQEMIAALDRAGETGPFVLVGYSFGGLLAANIARRYPEKVVRLVLLDATPLETVLLGPRLGSLRAMRLRTLASAAWRAVGRHADLDEKASEANPAHAEGRRAFVEALGGDLDAMRSIEIGVGAQLANYSIYRELDPDQIPRIAWETVVYDGDLGDMELWLVAPGDAGEVTAEREVGSAADGDAARMINFYARSRERYLAASSRSRRVVAPPGSTHQFVYTHADFVIGTLSEAVRR